MQVRRGKDQRVRILLCRFVVSGWPSRKETLPFLKQHYLNPHIIIVFNSLKEKALEEFEKLDPKDDLFCSNSLYI